MSEAGRRACLMVALSLAGCEGDMVRDAGEAQGDGDSPGMPIDDGGPPKMDSAMPPDQSTPTDVGLDGASSDAGDGSTDATDGTTDAIDGAADASDGGGDASE